jgi:hypothetical protein
VAPCVQYQKCLQSLLHQRLLCRSPANASCVVLVSNFWFLFSPPKASRQPWSRCQSIASSNHDGFLALRLVHQSQPGQEIGVRFLQDEVGWVTVLRYSGSGLHAGRHAERVQHVVERINQVALKLLGGCPAADKAVQLCTIPGRSGHSSHDSGRFHASRT